MLLTIGTFVIGLLLLTVGAELLVKGSSQLAVRFGLSPMFIGLTLVAYGTSMPELVVSTLAAVREAPGVAIGNVVGSNIFNLCIVLGVSALLRPVTCPPKLLRREVPVMILGVLVLALFSIGAFLSRIEASLLLIGLLAYTAWGLDRERRGTPVSQSNRNENALSPGKLPVGVDVGLAVLGLLALAAGASWLVDSAVDLAHRVGVSETIVGLTLVAAGTSLPELATSLVAVVRRQHEIALGNVIGSNIFNVLGILGIAGLLEPTQIPGRIASFDLPVVVLISILCVPLMATGLRVSRLEGGLLGFAYVVYVGWLATVAGL